jgi:succinate dehydrogenase / fumarate reductase cytochrome b subunit
MASAPRPVDKPRPIYLNLFAIRQPIPAIVSILHRVSGALLFVVGLPLALWGLQVSLASPEGYARVGAASACRAGRRFAL